MRNWMVWNIVFRSQEALKRHPTFRILKSMEASDRMSAQNLMQLRRAKLRAFIDYCHANVPYVRAVMQKCGIEPWQIRGPEDLPKLPLTTKAHIRRYRSKLRSRVAGKLETCATGGSTGTPLIFDLSRYRIASRVACRQRVSRWWDLSIGHPEIALWGSPVEITRQDSLRSLRDRLLRTRLLSAFEMNVSTMSRYLDILEAGKCRQIFSYPSAIYQLCVQARKQGRDLRQIGLKTVFVTGEVLFPYQRDLIAESLNCPVANGYGGRDSGFIAHECPHGGMHIMADAVIVEIVDSEGRTVPHGQSGEIVVTDLYSQDAPFLRYATGDIGVLSTRLCSCGRALPLLEQVSGRSNDAIVSPDGRLINSLAVVYPVREIEGIVQFRIVQKTVTSFHVQIVRDHNFSRTAESRIVDGWTNLLRAPVQVKFEYVPDLVTESSGKFRHVRSDITGSVDEKVADPIGSMRDHESA